MLDIHLKLRYFIFYHTCIVLLYIYQQMQQMEVEMIQAKYGHKSHLETDT